MNNAHPGLPELDYIKPKSLDEASQFLAQHAGEARPFLGGTDTFIRMRDGVWNEKYLVDVKGLDGTDTMQFDPARGLTIGAAVNMNRVIASADANQHYPLLVEAAQTVASYQLRTRATIVGNICNASPAGDTIGACMVFGGKLNVHGVNGTREEPLATFFIGPGRSTLKPGDVVTSLFLPVPPAGCKGRYIKVGRNSIGDLAIVGVTVLGYPDLETPSGYCFRIALASVAPVPLVPAQAEEILVDMPVTEATIETAALAAMEACSPIDDVRGSARYRRYMVRNMTRQALADVWKQIKGG